jgi:hypothetical protein
MRLLTLALILAVSYLAGVVLAPLVIAAVTYRLEIPVNFGWSVSTLSGPTPYREVSGPFSWLVSTLTGSTPYREVSGPFGWKVSTLSGPTPYGTFLGPFGWSVLTELVMPPFVEAASRLGWSVSVGVAPTPQREAPARLSWSPAVMNITTPDGFGFLEGWWVVFGPGSGANLTRAFTPYVSHISCAAPPCTFRFFLPLGVTAASVNATAGTPSVSVEGAAGGAFVTVTLDAGAEAEVRWIAGARFSVVDHRGSPRPASLRLSYVDGTNLTLPSNTPFNVTIFPLSMLAAEPAGRVVFNASQPGCSVGLSGGGILVAPPAAGARCELAAYYVMASSVTASLTPLAGGLYRVDGVLRDEEGGPVAGRTVLVILEGNATKPAASVTGSDGRFSALFYAPPSNATRRVTVRFPGEPALSPSSTTLEIAGVQAPAPVSAEIPAAAYALLGSVVAAAAAVVALSLLRASRRAQAAYYRGRRVLRGYYEVLGPGQALPRHGVRRRGRRVLR